MTVVYHPEFPAVIRKFETEYRQISEGLASRFRNEIDSALTSIKGSPDGAGQFLNLGTSVVTLFRRRYLKAFLFFILYAVIDEQLILGSVIPSRSDPLTWLTRFKREQ